MSTCLSPKRSTCADATDGGRLMIFLTLQGCESDTRSVETALRILNLIFSWASDVQYDTLP